MAEDVKVDKSATNELSDPLPHLVGNSMDYGLEPVKEGKQTKKNTEGSVQISPRSGKK